MHRDRGVGLLRERPERVVLGGGVERAVRERGDHHAAVAEVQAALHLGDGVVDAGGGQDALADEATVGAVAELGEPVVVGADARHLQLGLGAVDLGAEQGHARVEHLQVHPVDVHVGEARLGVEASRPHRLVAHADRREVEERQARGGGEAHRADALTVVERPVVALVAVDHLRRAVLVLRGHASHPGVGRLVDVRVAVEDRVVDGSVVVEEVARVLHLSTVSLPQERRNPSR